MMRIAVLLWLVCAFSGSSADAAEQMPSSRENSLYALSISMEDHGGRQRPLDLYRGHPVIVTMFYGSCPATCPLLIESIRATERELKQKDRDAVRVLLISLDSERDTPEALAKLAKSRRIDTERWTLARVKESNVRTLAAVLGVQYRKLPNGEFNHTSVLTLLSRDGTLGAQTTMLGKIDPTFAAAVAAEVARK